MCAAWLSPECSFSVYSFQRTKDWSSDMSLTESGLKANPGNAKLWYNRGVMRMEAGDSVGALADLKKSTLLWKDYSDPLMALSTHYYNAGDVRARWCRSLCVCVHVPHASGVCRPQLDKAFKYAQAITSTELPVGDLGKVLMYGAAFTRLAEINAKRGLPSEPFFAKVRRRCGRTCRCRAWLRTLHARCAARRRSKSLARTTRRCARLASRTPIRATRAPSSS